MKLNEQYKEEIKNKIDILSIIEQENEIFYLVGIEELKGDSEEEYIKLLQKEFKNIIGDLEENDLQALTYIDIYDEYDKKELKPYKDIYQYIRHINEAYEEEINQLIEISYQGIIKPLMEAIEYNLEVYDIIINLNDEDELMIENYKIKDNKFIHILKDDNDKERNKYLIDKWIIDDNELFKLLDLHTNNNQKEFYDYIEEIKKSFE